MAALCSGGEFHSRVHHIESTADFGAVFEGHGIEWSCGGWPFGDEIHCAHFFADDSFCSGGKVVAEDEGFPAGGGDFDGFSVGDAGERDGRDFEVGESEGRECVSAVVGNVFVCVGYGVFENLHGVFFVCEGHLDIDRGGFV